MLRSLIVRLKVLGGLDIANSRVPQDGRFSISAQGRAVDVRVATLPTAAGEAAVLRILDSKSEVAFSSLGLTEYETNRLLPHLHARQGAIVVTGPTGAGKTTTLYSMLREMNSREKSIMSIEDPVEYVMDGIKQIQVNNRANMGFAPALRSVLRSDPDVILVGEMRDAETARIAASASITGHLVLTSLHTTSAAATAMRLADMGVEPYMVASALTCVVSQRLARRLCEHCARPLLDADLSVLLELGAPESLLEGATLRTPVGCPACRETGYSGRRSIFEIMPVTEEIRRVIVERGSVADVERIAVEQGMDTLRVAALRRVVTGELSIDEMMRCAG
jgi:type IV pilus assembly protein PilB